ncbi:hypothetical protein [Priestia flexa]|uniref:hypothetical protein n=1 Tax=Priestia flexa TaxID=86664 RepID=UPI0030B9CDF7
MRFIYLESRSHHFHWMKAEAFQLEDFDRDMVGEHLLVAELDDKVVGFVSLYLCIFLIILFTAYLCIPIIQEKVLEQR